MCTINVSNAADNNVTIDGFNPGFNSGYHASDDDGNHYEGYCLEANETPPGRYSNESYVISKDNSNQISQDIKKLITKYHRSDMSNWRAGNIQIAIWVLNGHTTQFNGSSDAVKNDVMFMINNLDDVVNNTYTDSSGTKYTFNFYLGQSLNKTHTKQDIVFFNYNINETDIPGTNETNIPGISTNAINNGTGNRSAISEGIITIIDNVNYWNLTVGQTYVVNGYLMHKNGSYVYYNGSKVSATKTFTANSTNGVVQLVFVFDASELGNQSIVVFEYLTYENGTSVANHTDLNDINQTIEFTTKPEEPEPPIDPEKPEPPINPEEPEEPTKPEEPETPTNPEKPEPPINPEEPKENNVLKDSISNKTNHESKMLNTANPIALLVLTLLTIVGLLKRSKK
ncbi:VaFE repeat-containing surface-anchored protein [Methanobrevibacter sp. DSM 116169]|uniref:VaFE repeat-containing surface-anchored protein n=1 Tax=Methanobrevibacter sp. DSM 116169 TaxID=3242727 RepID=UPI0038FCAF05